MHIKLMAAAVFSITLTAAGETFAPTSSMPDKMQKQDEHMKMKGDKMKMKMEMSDLKTWPMATQNAIKEQMEKNG